MVKSKTHRNFNMDCQTLCSMNRKSARSASRNRRASNLKLPTTCTTDMCTNKPKTGRITAPIVFNHAFNKVLGAL